MATVTFYEKPGCQGNAHQKALLTAAGHEVVAKNLKAEKWNEERLLQFLAPLPVADWFNRAAPDVKSGEVKPESLSAFAAMSLLLANPLLIRRPLMEVGEERRVGFDAMAIAAWIGLGDAPVPKNNLEACVHGEGREGAGQCGASGETHDHEGHGHGPCGGH
jgi:nitrogenase-associated protein